MNIQGLYIKDIRNTAPISRKEEDALLKLAQEGNQKAREKLVKANMRFVLKIALQYRFCSVPLPDLITEGAMGLDHAAKRFDRERGLKFITYAVYWIRAFITRALNEQSSLIRIPANQHLRIRQSLKEFTTTADLPDDVQEFMQLSSSGTSIHQTVGTGRTTFGDTIPDASAANPEHGLNPYMADELAMDVLKILPEKELYIMKSLAGIGIEEPKTLREIGKEMDLSHERVRQLQKQAIRRILKSDDGELFIERFKQILASREENV